MKISFINSNKHLSLVQICSDFSFFKMAENSETLGLEPTTYLWHELDPRPPGRKRPSCSTPACGPGPAPRGTSAGTAVPGPRRGRALWIDPPVGRRGTTGTEVWGGLAARRGSPRRVYWRSSASRSLLELKLLLVPPGESEKYMRFFFFFSLTLTQHWVWVL